MINGDARISKAAAVARQRLAVALVTAISQTGVVAFSFTPGYAFEVVRVRSYCLLKAGTVTGKVKVSTREAVPALAFTTATEVGATLATTAADRKGSASDAITIEYTSDGAGVLTNGFVVVEIRPLATR